MAPGGQGYLYPRNRDIHGSVPFEPSFSRDQHVSDGTLPPGVYEGTAAYQQQPHMVPPSVYSSQHGQGHGQSYLTNSFVSSDPGVQRRQQHRYAHVPHNEGSSHWPYAVPVEPLYRISAHPQPVPSVQSHAYHDLPPEPQPAAWRPGYSARGEIGIPVGNFPGTHAAARNLNNETQRRKEPTLSVSGGSFLCGLCNIECNSKDILEQHFLGKKHKRKVEQLEARNSNGMLLQNGSSTSMGAERNNDENPSANVVGTSNVNVVSPQASNQNTSNSGIVGMAEEQMHDSKPLKRKKSTCSDINLKRQRILDSGATESEIRICSICNTVCNSQTVFESHLSGKKHASMARRHLGKTIKVTASGNQNAR